jgi:hypothetical protein
MASEVLSADAGPSLALYFAVTNAAGQFFDFADSIFKALSHNTINGVTTGGAGTAAFEVPGNIAASLVVGKSIRVRGSTGAVFDGVYTLRAGSAYSGGNTTVNVAQAVAGSPATDGILDLNATPYLSSTENVNGGGAGVSRYVATLNLNLVNPTTTPGQYNVQALQPTDTSTWPVPDADTPQSAAASLTVQLGLKGVQDVRAKLAIATTSTAGTNCQLAAWLECNGQVVPLGENTGSVDPSATAAAIVAMFGQTTGGSPTFAITTGDFATPNTDNRFEYALTFAGFTADQLYHAVTTLTVNGNTFEVDEPFPVFP